MSRIPDLVRDSQLEVEFRDGYTIHKHFASSLGRRQRPVAREEIWRQETHIAGGAYGSVYLETCIGGNQKGSVRAVKKIAIRQPNARDAVTRELEAIAKFSNSKVLPFIF